MPTPPSRRARDPVRAPRSRAAPARLVTAGCLAIATLIAVPPRLQPPVPAGATAAPSNVAAAATTAETPRPSRTPRLTVAAPTPAAQGAAPSPGAAPRSRPPHELTGYVWPVRNARITTWFQHTVGGFIVLDVGRVHDGIDLATFCGDWVLAAHDGTVLYAGRKFDGYLGFNGSLDAFYAELARRELTLNALPIVIVVDDGNGYRSVYVHLREALVQRGQRVKAGEPIGREGATGHATGCHLHYSLIRADGPFQAVAPQLVEKWHYPRLLRERVDPMRVLSLAQDGAGRVVRAEPPERSPTYGSSQEAVPRPRTQRPGSAASPGQEDAPLPSGG